MRERGTRMLALFFVLILLGIVAFAVMVAADITIPEEEVFALLSHWQWKSGLEIKAEYRQKKKVPEWRSVGGTLYTALYRLEREGWVEVRERELSSEQFARRGNRPQLPPTALRRPPDNQNKEKKAKGNKNREKKKQKGPPPPPRFFFFFYKNR